MTAHDFSGAAAQLHESFQQMGDKDTRGQRGLGCGKDLSYFWMTQKPSGCAWLLRHPRPIVRSCKDTMFLGVQAK